jgi:tRNA threonylcarbamoyladenosine biosynthesis protein TsaB
VKNNQKTEKPIEKQLILALETSGRLGSVAIALGENLLDQDTFSGPMRHSVEIFPRICKLLARYSLNPSEIEQIYLSAGPGSFTGLRIAVAMAKTLHLANTAKIVAVDTLDAIAANADYLLNSKSGKSGLEKIAAILDAKRGQFFIAVYQRQNQQNQWKKTLLDSIMTAQQFLETFPQKERPIYLLGEGLVYYKDRFKADGIDFLDETCWTPTAAKIHQLGWQKALANQFADASTFQPIYLRMPAAEEKRIFTT